MFEELGFDMVTMMNENIILLAAVFAATVFDYKFRKVPNFIVFPVTAVAFIIAFMRSGFMGISGAIIGMLLGIALLIVPYANGGIGAGDVKLLGAIGALKGAGFVFASFLGAAIIGGIMAVSRMAFMIKGSDMRILGQSIRTASYTGMLSAIEIPEYALKDKLPYAVAISAGAVIAMILEMR